MPTLLWRSTSNNWPSLKNHISPFQIRETFELQKEGQNRGIDRVVFWLLPIFFAIRLQLEVRELVTPAKTLQFKPGDVLRQINKDTAAFVSGQITPANSSQRHQH